MSLGKPSRGKVVDREGVVWLYKQGLSMNEIGRRLGHHHGVIAYHIHKSGIPLHLPRQRWVIHHLNGKRGDNRLENLAAMPRKRHSPGLIVKPYQDRIVNLELTIYQLQKEIKKEK